MFSFLEDFLKQFWKPYKNIFWNAISEAILKAFLSDPSLETLNKTMELQQGPLLPQWSLPLLS